MKIFVSSTWKDLQTQRELVIAALRRAGFQVVNPYEANPKPPLEALEEDIRGCDCLVGLIGHCYGSRIAPGERSFTEFEYDACGEPNGPHTLMFLAYESFPVRHDHSEKPALKAAQRKLREKIRARAGYFSENTSELVEQVLVAVFHHSARRKIRIEGAPIHHLPDRFEDRVEPRQTLCDWLIKSETPIAEVVGRGGVGKSSLCWVWLAQDILGRTTCGARELPAPHLPPVEGVIWWAFAPDSGRFDQFVKIALGHFCPEYDASPTKRSPAEDLGVLLNALEKKRFVVVLDGFERLLDGYNPAVGGYPTEKSSSAPDNIANPDARYFVREILNRRNKFQSRIVMTSRAGMSDPDHTDEGRMRIELQGLPEADAIRLFADSSTASDETTSEDAPIVLAIHTLSQKFGSDPALWQAVKGMVTRKKFDISAISETAKSWSDKAGSKTLFGDFLLDTVFLGEVTTGVLRTLSAIRGPFSVQEFEEVFTKIKVRRGRGETIEQAAEKQLAVMVNMGLVKRIDLGTEPGSERLFVLSAAASNRYVKLLKVEPTDPIGERLQTPRAVLNLISTVRGDLACELLKIIEDSPAYRFGGIQTEIELLQTLLPRCSTPNSTGSERVLFASKLQLLALQYSRTGQPDLAIANLKESIAVFRELDDMEGAANGLGMIAVEHLRTGKFAEAESDLNSLIALCRGTKHEPQMTRAMLALVIVRNADHEGIESLPLDTFLKTCFEGSETQAAEFHTIFHALRALRMGEPSRAVEYARHALEQVATGDLVLQTRVHWLMAESLLRLMLSTPAHATESTDTLAEADRHLIQASECCELLFWPDYWADILISQARLRLAQGDAAEAGRVAGRARMHCARHKYRLKLADVHNLLSQISYDAGDIPAALIYASEAKSFADCGEDPYKYQPAFDIAEGMTRACTSKPTDI